MEEERTMSFGRGHPLSPYDFKLQNISSMLGCLQRLRLGRCAVEQLHDIGRLISAGLFAENHEERVKSSCSVFFGILVAVTKFLREQLKFFKIVLTIH